MSERPFDLFVVMMWHPARERWTATNAAADFHFDAEAAEVRRQQMAQHNPDKTFKVWRFLALDEDEGHAGFDPRELREIAARYPGDIMIERLIRDLKCARVRVWELEALLKKWVASEKGTGR